jgi:hypothetical protein
MVFQKGYIPWNKGLTGIKTNNPGQKSWNKGTKGICKANSASFKKGAIPWNKGKNMPKWIKDKLREAHLNSTNEIGEFKVGHPDYNAHKPRELQPNWKGGTYKHRGYYYVFVENHPHAIGGRYIKRSRHIVEQHLGRYLFPEEVVHHINGITDDDRFENLQVFPNRNEHMRFHKLNKI